MTGSCKKDVLRLIDPQQIQGLPGVRWNRIVVVPNSLWIVAGGEKFGRADILITRDGGINWSHQSFPEIGKGLYGLDARDDGSTVACGFSANILTAGSGARDFLAQPVLEERYFVAAAALPRGYKVLLSTSTFQSGTAVLLDSTNNVVSDHTFPFGLSDVSFADSARGYAAGYGAILVTGDGGRKWDYTPAAHDHFVALDVHGPDTVYACGNTGGVLRTANSGGSWQTLRSSGGFSQPGYALQDLVFTDPDHGYCVGEDGLVIYTDDAGSHWTEFERFTTAHLRGIAALPGGDLLVCGDGGALWRLKAP